MQSHILVPLDGSVAAETVLPHAIALARTADSIIILVRVISLPFAVEPLSWSADTLVSSGRTDRDEMKVASAYLAGVANHLRTVGVVVQTEVLEGDPATRIVERAGWYPTTVLVAMATHGRSGVSHVIYGSVAE